jgi:hypothetical protein
VRMLTTSNPATNSSSILQLINDVRYETTSRIRDQKEEDLWNMIVDHHRGLPSGPRSGKLIQLPIHIGSVRVANYILLNEFGEVEHVPIGEAATSRMVHGGRITINAMNIYLERTEKHLKIAPDSCCTVQIEQGAFYNKGSLKVKIRFGKLKARVGTFEDGVATFRADDHTFRAAVMVPPGAAMRPNDDVVYIEETDLPKATAKQFGNTIVLASGRVAYQMVENKR